MITPKLSWSWRVLVQLVEDDVGIRCPLEIDDQRIPPGRWTRP
jgi:hypothetical protein